MTEVEKLIPHRPPFLFVDEIVSHDGDVLTARRTWRAEEDFYKGHYPGAPITPGVLLCEAVFQTGALLMAKLMSGAAGQSGVPLLTKVTEVRFRLPVYPGDTTIMEVRLPGMPPIQCLSTTIVSGHFNCVPARAIAWTRASSSPLVMKLAEPIRNAAISMSE